MDHVLTCTTEELALLVTLCGYPSVAKGIEEAAVGEKSPAEWTSMMEGTIHQLQLKRLWDYEKERRDEIPLSEEMQQFITQYIQSNWILRCTNIPNQNLLMFHHVEKNTWLTHVIERDIIHEFAYVSSDEIPNIIKDYYSFSTNRFDDMEAFNLSDKAFDLLSHKGRLKKFQKMCRFSPKQEHSFHQFVEDLDKQDWSLYNISFFHIPSYEEDPSLENIVFFLPSVNGVWIIEYTDHPSTPVHITLGSTKEWQELLEGIGSVVRYE
ncbi:hypothetical protein [Neobacillus sp. LXY-4]|uniref:hypothetical protein n=1 Tax=Neobacillus sp. LXY-4 TaxID=3379826 RepID=UPI003EE2D416